MGEVTTTWSPFKCHKERGTHLGMAENSLVSDFCHCQAGECLQIYQVSPSQTSSKNLS